MKDHSTKGERPGSVSLLDTGGAFGDFPDSAAVHEIDDIKTRLSRMSPDVIVLNHTPWLDDPMSRQYWAKEVARTICKEVAPTAKVVLVSKADPGLLAATYRAALEYLQGRDRGELPC